MTDESLGLIHESTIFRMRPKTRLREDKGDISLIKKNEIKLKDHIYVETKPLRPSGVILFSTVVRVRTDHKPETELGLSDVQSTHTRTVGVLRTDRDTESSVLPGPVPKVLRDYQSYGPSRRSGWSRRQTSSDNVFLIDVVVGGWRRC